MPAFTETGQNGFQIHEECLSSLMIKEIKNKAIMRYHFKLTSW